MELKLRKYQVDTLTDLEGHLAFDNKAVVPLPGGGGKSAILAEIARKAHEEKQYCVILTNLTALVPQLAKHMDEFKVPYNIVKAGSHHTEPNAYVSLIMEQSFHKEKRKELNIQCDILCKDEQHIGIGQKRYEDIVKDLNPDKIIGTTFTPIDENGYLMNGISPENIVETVSVNDLVKDKYLAPLKYFVPLWAEEKDYTEIASSGNDFNGKELEEIIDTDEHTKLVIQSMNSMNAKEKYTLVYAGSVLHADNINNTLNEDGYESVIVHSKMSAEHNALAIEWYNNKIDETFEEFKIRKNNEKYPTLM